MMLVALTGLLMTSVSLAPSETPERGPGAGADQDEGVGVDRPDDRDDLLGVALDRGPAHAAGLVGDLVQDVVLGGVARCAISVKKVLALARL